MFGAKVSSSANVFQFQGNFHRNLFFRFFYFEIPLGSILFKRTLMRSGLKIINGAGAKIVCQY